MHSWARMGAPAATLPTMGTCPGPGTASPCSGQTVMARVFPLSLVIRPAASSPFRWKWTVEGDLSPTCSPISRTDGG